MRTLLVVFVAAAVGLGCNDMPGEPSLLEGPRILAIQASAGDNGTVRLTALAHEVDTFAWSACPTPWIPALDPQCPLDALDLGAGNPLDVSVPDGVERVWVRLDAPGALPAIVEVASEGGLEQPLIDAIEAAEGGAPGPTIAASGDLELVMRGTSASGNALVTTWYVTVGRADPWRTLGDNPVTIEAPEEAGPLEVLAVVRDGTGGVAWHRLTLEVTP